MNRKVDTTPTDAIHALGPSVGFICMVLDSASALLRFGGLGVTLTVKD